MDRSLLRRARACADLACPQRCAACDAPIAAGLLLCHACRRAVNALAPPECPRCGVPRAVPGPCPRCVAAPNLAIRSARAWAAYDVASATGPVAHVVAALKYQRRTRLARRMAGLMAARVPDPGVEVVAPVPLHVRRLRARGFNQSALLARHLARALRRRSVPDLLLRTRDTPSQIALTRAARAVNVAGAFTVRRPALVRRRTVLVVDDVWTSGATATSVAVALRQAGATAVDVVTFARVV